MLTTGPRRQKESLGERLDLAPVRLVGGFVCVDTHLGCIGCPFCLNRRYPAPRRVLEARLHAGCTARGFPPARIAAIVRALPSWAAGVPVRIGNLSDVAFGAADVREVVERLDDRHPVFLASRFPVREPVARLLRARRSALLHLTLTPPAPGDRPGPAPLSAERVVASTAGLPPERIFHVVGPLAAGTEREVARLLGLLPRGAAIGFKELKVDPLASGLAPMAPDRIDRLRAEARGAGFRVLRFAGCQARANLGRPFFRAREASRLDPEGCACCVNRTVCAAVREPAPGALAAEVRRLGLEPGAVLVEDGRASVGVDQPASRAEEVYLSERFGVEVRLTGVWRGDRLRIVELEERLLARWERTGFYPVGELSR